MQLADEEPEAGPWRAEPLTTVIEALVVRGRDRGADGRPVILAVDGRSNAGKTTLAARIEASVPGSTIVHTDDVAWEHSRFGWSDLLILSIPPRRSLYRNHDRNDNSNYDSLNYHSLGGGCGTKA